MADACSALIDDLVALRKEKGISQKELSAACGLTQSVIARIKRKRRVVSRVMRKFDLALAEIYFRGRVHAPWLPSSGQGAKGQGRRYAARLALDAL